MLNEVIEGHLDEIQEKFGYNRANEIRAYLVERASRPGGTIEAQVIRPHEALIRRPQAPYREVMRTVMDQNPDTFLSRENKRKEFGDQLNNLREKVGNALRKLLMIEHGEDDFLSHVNGQILFQEILDICKNSHRLLRHWESIQNISSVFGIELNKVKHFHSQMSLYLKKVNVKNISSDVLMNLIAYLQETLTDDIQLDGFSGEQIMASMVDGTRRVLESSIGLGTSSFSPHTASPLQQPLPSPQDQMPQG